MNMIPERKLSRSQGVLLLFAVLVATGLLTLVFGGKASIDRRPVMIGADRIVAREQSAEVNGPMCEFVPASASQQLVASARPAVDPSAPKTRPSKAERDALAKRAPKYTMKDSNPGYAGIAVDPTRNEVILADENMFGIHVFDRTTN